jgi:hypothetical protein
MTPDGKIEKASSGLPNLDRVLNGGFPASSIVCVIANPVANADLLLYRFSAARKTYYIANSKRPEEIKSVMMRFGLDAGSVSFIADDTSKYLIDLTLRKIKGRGESNLNIVIDNFSFYLRSKPETEVIKRILDTVRDAAVASKGVVFLYIYKNTHSKDIENLILGNSDVLLDVDVGGKQETILSIPKMQGPLPSNKMRVILGDRIEIEEISTVPKAAAGLEISRQRTGTLLQSLDEQYRRGEISKETYEELKSRMGRR